MHRFETRLASLLMIKIKRDGLQHMRQILTNEINGRIWKPMHSDQHTHTHKESELSTQHHWPKMNSLRETVPWRSWWKQTYISHSQPKHFPSVGSYGLLHLPLYTVERSWACEEGYSTWLDTTMKLKLSPSADSILSECRIIWCALHNSSFYYF